MFFEAVFLDQTWPTQTRTDDNWYVTINEEDSISACKIILCCHWLEVWAWYQKSSFISASQERYWKRGLIVISVFPLPACCVSLSFIKQPCVCLQMQDFTGHPLSARSPVTSRLPSILCHVFSVGSKKAALSGQCRLAGVSVCVAVRWEPSPLANTWPAHLPALHPPSLNHELLLRSNAESIRAICKFGAMVLLTHSEWLTMLSRQQQTT